MTQVEVVDREKQRKEKENTPEGKKAKKIRLCLEIAAFIILFSVLYVVNHNPNAKKDMVTVTVQGVEIVPGKTTVQDILEGGFSLADQQVANVIDPAAVAEANSYYTMICLVKENKEYGRLTIANDSNMEQEIPKCKVLKISIYHSNEDADQVLVDGTAIKDLTYEQLVDSYGEPASSEETTYIEGTDVKWESKEYFFSADVAKDGTIYSVESSYGRR